MADGEANHATMRPDEQAIARWLASGTSAPSESLYVIENPDAERWEITLPRVVFESSD